MKMRKKLSVCSILGLALLLAFIPALLSAGQEAGKQVIRLRVAADEANLREKPDISSGIVQLIPSGTILEADRKEGEWYFVRYTLEDGGVMGGYIHESLVMPVNGDKKTETAPAAGKPGPRPSDHAKEARPMSAGWTAGTRTGFELSFSVGPASIEADDLNDGAVGFADATAAAFSTSYLGSIHELNRGGALAIELGYRVSPRVFLGISMGTILINRRNSSYEAGLMTIPENPQTVTISMNPGLRVHPFQMVARYYPGRNLYIRAGAGYYQVKTEYLYRTDYGDTWQRWDGEASAGCFGAELAIGGEINLNRRWTLFGEAGFRMASTDSFDGTETYTDSSDAVVLTNGPLWYYRNWDTETAQYTHVKIHANQPNGDLISNVRRSEVNLSGATMKIGVRLRF